MRPKLPLAALAIVPGCGGLVLATTSSPVDAGPPPAPVLVELYQSQGCSSCPPANANLNALADRSDVIALSFAVTYWDRLGWKDTFAKPQFTARQWEYARANGRPNVATPQMWVNGRTTIVGHDAREVARTIQAAKTAGPALSLSGGIVSVEAGKAPQGGADVWLAWYDPRAIAVPIRAGENSGRTLPHRNIVRRLVNLGRWTGTSVRYPAPPPPSGLRAAAFVQGGHGRPVLAAANAS